MFADRLREARNAKGLSQRDVARSLYVSPQAVGKWERNEATPGPDAIAKLAELLCVSTDWLLDTKSPAEDLSEAKRALIDLIDSLSDEQVARLYEIAKAALAL